MTDKNEQLLTQITEFIQSIGIPCSAGIVAEGSFLPGVDIVNGAIVYDAEKLLSPGDLLHEAGHIAVLKNEDRQLVTSPNVSGDVDEGAAEMAAIAWSWAALKHLDIEPEIVFHNDGYKGDAENLIENFSNGRHIGASLLQWMGMTTEQKNGDTSTESVYPVMQHWLRQ